VNPTITGQTLEARCRVRCEADRDERAQKRGLIRLLCSAHSQHVIAEPATALASELPLQVHEARARRSSAHYRGQFEHALTIAVEVRGLDPVPGTKIFEPDRVTRGSPVS